MNKKNFTDALSDETLINLTNELLKQENINKTRKKFRFELLKIIPAAAAVILVIGAINLLPTFLKNTSSPSDNGDGNNTNLAAAATNSTTLDISNIINNIMTNTTETNPDDNNTTDNPDPIVIIGANDDNFADINSEIPSNNTLNTNMLIVSISPGNEDKYQRNGLNNYRCTTNFNTIQKESVKIEINGVTISTNDAVNIKNNDIIIGGDTFIDEYGNVTKSGTGSCTITKADSATVDVNLPQVNQADEDALAADNYAKSGLNGIRDLLPYMSESKVDELVKTEYDKSGMKNIPDTVIPFMSRNSIDEIAKTEYDNNGLKNFSDTFLYVISGTAIDDIARAEYDKNGLKNFSGEFLSILFAHDRSILAELAKEEYDKNGLKNLSDEFLSLLFVSDKSVIDEIAKAEYDKNGAKNFPSKLYSYMSDSLKAELGITQNDVYSSVSSYGYNYNAGWYTIYYSANGGTNTLVKFSDGNKITMPGGASFSAGDNNKSNLYIQCSGNCTIEYKNGITVNAPTHTIAEGKKDAYTITIGDGDATITQPDGTTSTVPAGTVLDNQGNVVTIGNPAVTVSAMITSTSYEFGKVQNVTLNSFVGKYTIEKSTDDKTTVEVSGYAYFINLLNVDYSDSTGTLTISYDKTKAAKIDSNTWNAQDNSLNIITIKLAYDGDKPQMLSFATDASGSVTTSVPFQKLATNINGSGSVSAPSIDFGDVNIKINGSGSVNFNDADSCTMSINGSGSVNFNNATTSSLTINGSGNVTGHKIPSLTSSINGSGNMNFAESDDFKASISGSGNITADKVNKSVSASINGSGEIDINSGNVDTFTAYIDSGSNNTTIDAKNVTAVNADITIKNKGTVQIGKITGNENLHGF